MAKKGKTKFNMAEEIRAVLKSKPTASNKDVFAVLAGKFGKGSFNEASCGVAVSNARRKMGLGKGRSVRKRKPTRAVGRPAGAKRAGRPARATNIDISALQAAKSLLAAVDGDESAAVSALRQLSSLQIQG